MKMDVTVYKILKKESGLTFLEIIAVLAIMGILAAIAVSRSINYDAEVYAGADALKSHLRYAQTLAMNRNPNAGITIWGISGTANSYWLFQGINPANPASFIRLPENDTFINADRTINLIAKKIKLTANFTIYFDNRGIPYTAYVDATIGNNTPLPIPMIINVQPLNAAAPNIAVTITPLTGYIP
jgi:prepilin-type N-terminal cleavage/methylation domain-containing protein